MQRTRRIWLALHKYLGLTLGVFVLINALTGASIVYYKELLKVGAADLQQVPEHATRMSLVDVAEILAVRNPKQTLLKVANRGTQAESVMSAVLSDAHGVHTEILIDPYTGQVRGERSPGGLMGQIFHFHASFLQGPPGRYAVAALGFFLTLSILSGMVLWWPRPRYVRRSFRIVRRSPRFWVHLHSVPGVYAVIVTLLVVISGFMVALPEWFKESPDLDDHPESIEQEGIDVAAAAELAQERFPGTEFYTLQFDMTDGSIEVRLKVPPAFDYADDKTVAIGPQGNILWVRDHSSFSLARRMLEIYPIKIHSGNIAGEAGRILVLLTGLILGMSAALGIFVYFRSNRRTKRIGSE